MTWRILFRVVTPLEVSSPGLDRKLTKPAEFEHFTGRKARLVLRDPVDEQKVLEGRLAGCAGGIVKLDMGEGELKEFPLDKISKAQLVVEL